MSEMLVERLTWPEFAEQIGRRMVLIPVGSVEQHGPHLPLGTDVFIVWHLAERLARRLPALIAPPIWYAAPSDPASGGGQRFPGTMSLRGSTLLRLVGDVLREYFRHGARHLVLLNGHFENTAFLAEAAREVLPPEDTSGRRIVLVNWWEHVPEAVLRDLFPEGFPGWEVEHASLTESSLMLALAPALVHAERIPQQPGERRVPPRHKVFPEPAGQVPPSGILYTAAGASPERGEALVAVLVETLAALLAQEFPQVGQEAGAAEQVGSG